MDATLNNYADQAVAINKLNGYFPLGMTSPLPMMQLLTGQDWGGGFRIN